MAMIDVRGLTKRYDFGRVRGIENMEFSVNEGELFGFIGPNGAGKSTTIRILMNMLKADSGKALVGGLDSRRCSREIKRFTGYMPSEVRCYPGVRVGELLDYACRLRGERPGIWKDKAAYYSLDPDKRFRELSVGNRRKLSIVQAMMGDPGLLILDEPTGGLDPIMQEKFFAELIRARSEGATVFFSSHNLGEVQRFCDRVAIVKDGHVEMMPDIRALPMHMVELRSSSDCGALIAGLDASDVRRDGNRLSFMIPGEQLGRLMRLLADIEVEDIAIAKPSLERMFHRIYSGEDMDA